MKNSFHHQALWSVVLAAVLSLGASPADAREQNRGHADQEQNENRRDHRKESDRKKQSDRNDKRRGEIVAQKAREHRQASRSTPRPVAREWQRPVGKQIDAPRRVERERQRDQPRRIVERHQAEHRVEQPRRVSDFRGHNQRQRLSRESQERRIREERQRAERFRHEHESRQRLAAERRARQLGQHHRINQFRYQQQYYDRLRQQQALWTARRYDYHRDPYYYTPPSHRYSYNGRYYQTNRYGADLIRQAVNHGYREGLRAGRADRADNWRNDYRNSYAYQDASYGYHGRYIDQDQYNHYFRQGFERGYDDGYSSQYRHGYRDDDGNYAILAAVLAAVVGFQLLN